MCEFLLCLFSLPEGLYFDIKRENEKNNAGLQYQAVRIKRGKETSTKGEDINNVLMENVLEVKGVRVFLTDLT